MSNDKRKRKIIERKLKKTKDMKQPTQTMSL